MLLKAKHEHNISHQTDLLLAIGQQYSYQKNDLGFGLQYFTEARRLAHLENDCEKEISSIMFQNLIVFALKDYKTFLKNYEHLEVMYQKCPTKKRLLYVYTQLAWVNFINTKNLALAKHYFSKVDSCLNTEKLSNTSIKHEIFAYSTLMEFYKKTKQHKVLKVKKQMRENIATLFKNFPEQKPLNYDILKEFFMINNELDSAIYCAKILSTIPPQNYQKDDQELIFGSYDVLADLYEKEKKYVEALKYKNRYIQILDSLALIDKKNTGIDKINLIVQQNNLERSQRELAFNRILIILISIIVLMSLFSIYFFYRKNQKIQRLYKKVNNQNEELTHLNIVRKKMFSILSHDLVSPIGALKSTIELYQKGLFEKDEFEKNIDNIKSNLNAVLSTIKSIVSWSHTISNKSITQITTFSFYQLIQELFELQMANIQLKNLELVNDVREDFMIIANYNHISLIARNLIDNSVKYLPKGGRLTVRIKQTKTEIILIFQDNGLGIQQKIIDNIFSQDALNYENQTIHLGFQMINDIIKINNYKIEIDSQPNVGSIFKIYIPNH